MTYGEALRWIYGFADLERGVGHAGREAYAAGPARTRRLLGALGDPQQGLTCAHVGGSKGKGSVCALVAAAAEAAGLRTGAYTQPHLHSVPRARRDRRPAHRPARLRRSLPTDSAASRGADRRPLRRRALFDL